MIKKQKAGVTLRKRYASFLFMEDFILFFLKTTNLIYFFRLWREK